VKKWINKLEKTFAAVSFAEAGEHNTAIQMAGLKPYGRKKMFDFSTYLDRIFAAVSFAEAGCPEIAQEFISKNIRPKDVKSIDAFLETVGLQGVRVSYGLAFV